MSTENPKTPGIKGQKAARVVVQDKLNIVPAPSSSSGVGSAQTSSLLTSGPRLGPQRAPAPAMQQLTSWGATSTGARRIAASGPSSTHLGGLERSLSCRAPSQPTSSHQAFRTPTKGAASSSVDVDSLCTEFRSKTALRVPADRHVKDQMQLSGLATGVLKPRIRPGDDSSWFSPPRGGRNLSRELRGLGVSAGGMGGGEVTKPEAPSRPVPATSTASTAAHPSISNHSGGSSGGGGWGGGSVTWTSSAGLAAATTTAATATATHAANATGPSASQPAAAPPSGTQPAVGCAGGHTTPDTATSALSSGACGDGAGGCGGKLGISAAYPAGSGSWGGAVSGDGAVGCRPAKEAASAAQLAAGRTQIPSADAPARATSSCSGPYAAAGGATESGAAEATSSRLRVAAAATAAEARADSGSHRAAQSCGEHRGAPPQQMQMLGSLQRFSPVKAGRAHREQLGTDVILTPVRRSARTSHKPTTPIGALLEMTNFAFVNNAFLND